MQNKLFKSHVLFEHIKFTKPLIILFTVIALTSCGNSHPELTHLKVFDERFTTVLETENSSQLTLFSELFYDRLEVKNVQADLNFVYLFDLTTASDSQRWRCTVNGYCQQRLEGAVPHRELFYLERYKELYQMSKLN